MITLGYTTTRSELYIFQKQPMMVPKDGSHFRGLMMDKLQIYNYIRNYQSPLELLYAGIYVDISKRKRLSSLNHVESVYFQNQWKFEPIFVESLPPLVPMNNLGLWSIDYYEMIDDTLDPSSFSYSACQGRKLMGSELLAEMRMAFSLLNYKLML